MSSANLASNERSSNTEEIQQEDGIQQTDTQEVLHLTLLLIIDSCVREEASTRGKQGYQHERVDEGVQFGSALSTLYIGHTPPGKHRKNERKIRKKKRNSHQPKIKKEPHYN